jgi:hypothetical protein
MSGKKIVVAGLSAGIAFAALTGCTQPAGKPIAGAPISSPATSAPATAAPATSAPSSTHTSSPAKPTKTSSGQGGSGQGGSNQGGSVRDGWGGVNFNKVLFRTLGCVDNAEAKGKAELYSVSRADLTGDGWKDAVVAGSCIPLSGPDHSYVLVLDGAKAGDHPTTLITIGKGQDLTTADVKVGHKITVSSKALSADAPLCCSDLQITQVWEGHRNGDFVRTSLTTRHIQN